MPPRRSHLRTAQVACGLLLLLVVTGCAFLSAASATGSALGKAGYQDASLNLSSGSGLPANGMVTVSYSQGPAGSDQDDALRAERIVWEGLHYRFGALAIVKTAGGCTGPVCVSRSTELDSATYAQLLARFGARPAGLDTTSGSNAIGVPGWALGAGLAALAVLAAAVVIVVLVRRSRKRRLSPGELPKLL